MFKIMEGNSNSHFIRLFTVSLALSCLLTTSAETNIITDQSALLALKTHITSDPSDVLANWTVSSPVCHWIGITCGNRHHRVTAVNVSNMDLTGTIPPEFGNLTFLVSVDARNNDFRGRLSENLARLRRLRFVRLGYNSFTGNVPSWSRLELLSLRNNSFTSFDSFLLSFSNESNLDTLDMSFNSLQGEIPESIGNLRNLKALSLEGNRLSGPIPSSITNMSSLETLILSRNLIRGMIPETIGNLRNLNWLNIEGNQLTGSIPLSIFNISTLELISFARNSLSGTLPDDMCLRLPILKGLYLSYNEIRGQIPSSFSSCPQLQTLSLSKNDITGTIPQEIGSLEMLEILYLGFNKLTGEIPTEIGNLGNLQFIGMENNLLRGSIPFTLFNLSFLQRLSLADNGLSGTITEDFGNLTMLRELYLGHNNFTGVIPRALSSLKELEILDMGINSLTGPIPSDIFNISTLRLISLTSNSFSGNLPANIANLGALYLSENQLSCPIPECLGNVSSLRGIHLYSNNLTSIIPASIWDLQDLLDLDISSNSFTGSLSPQIGNLKAATFIDLSMNQFSQDIPTTLGGLQRVTNLSLAYNRFRGSIPESLGSMLNLISLDLSHNSLSGKIPKSFQTLKHLEYFNVSFNELSGEIPKDGPFRNFTSQSFSFNTALCGPPLFQVSSCHASRKNKVLRDVFIPLGIGILILTVTMAFITIRYRRKKAPPTALDISATARISYYELLQATNEYSENNLLGRGGFGSVYKGVLRDGTILAVKVFNMQQEGALRTFDAECEVLRNLRHRNLNKVITSCSNLDFKALVLEYMPNGSLEKWLYSENCFLDIMQRFNIMMNVASALEYLHHGYSTPVVHCDLKPGNVLIDENMVAHVSDFGITRFLSEEESITHTRTLATLGYMAPEYGLEGIVSTRCDVYSYGIMLLETFTRKRPSDEMFDEGMNLKNLVKDSLQQNALIQVVDANLISPEEENFSEKMCCVSSVMELAMRCLAESPGERMNMKDVVAELKKIKLQLMVYYTGTS